MYAPGIRRVGSISGSVRPQGAVPCSGFCGIPHGEIDPTVDKTVGSKCHGIVRGVPYGDKCSKNYSRKVRGNEGAMVSIEIVACGRRTK